MSASNAISCLTGNTYAFVDVETTGSSAQYGQIIEIGIIRVEDGVIVDTYKSLINPGRSLSPMITQITGITDGDLRLQPAFDEVALAIREILDGAVFVAHNARFDYGFIKNEFKRLGIAFNAKTLCTVKVSRLLFPTQKSHSLENIIAVHNIAVLARHRAYDDSEALIKFLQAAEVAHSPEQVSAAIKAVLGNHILPSNIDPKIIANLPHAPGVYFFYDKDDALLYIGKSVDIKNRVRSHFGQSHTSNKERAITTQVTYIDYETTTGELSALLKESAYIKELMPAYNRRLRSASRLAIFKSSLNEQGFKTGSIFYQPSDDIYDLSNIEGIFRTVSAGKAVMHKSVEEFHLCPKLLGLEKGKGACFQHQLGRCLGACVGKEEPQTYNLRFTAAYAKMRVRSWPFKGPITLAEDPEAEEGTAYVVDQWKIKKRVSYTSEGHVEEDIELPFDFDTYRILSKHLLKAKGVVQKIS